MSNLGNFAIGFASGFTVIPTIYEVTSNNQVTDDNLDYWLGVDLGAAALSITGIYLTFHKTVTPYFQIKHGKLGVENLDLENVMIGSALFTAGIIELTSMISKGIHQIYYNIEQTETAQNEINLLGTDALEI